ncbi:MULTISPECIES: glycogen debranching protein [unclassified Algoriphagus]|jgi:glycogen debranching enzyme|nr:MULTISPECIES: glycogen debranching protein [unclassified Algoriphagus]MAL12155.1 glycogen debranching protein [Algoriphagus sp.]QYH40453.1 glycogen debranching protein [Algoriphagus sp. NBT04N3]HCH45351.1 glycogen debranching protein [Algoriphagus sp.]
MKKTFTYLIFCLALISCSETQDPFSLIFEDLESQKGLAGKKAYLASPFTAAGDRVYLIGNQDGSFPDMGWHVEGEMGGIWMHPIKLMDGFSAQIQIGDQKSCLENAEAFMNYPFSNLIEYDLSTLGLKVERLHFVPDGKEGMVVLYRIKNVDKSEKSISFNWSAKVDLMPVWLGERSGMIDQEDQVNFDEMSQTFWAKDLGNDWYVSWKTDPKFQVSPVANSCEFESKGKGLASTFSTELSIPADGAIIFPVFIAGSTNSQLQAFSTLAEIQENLAADWFSKKERYQLLKSTAQIQVPDQELQEAFEWVKYNTDWLVRDVPEIGRGFGAGLQDYPWFFGVDSEYTIQGLLATGRKELVYSTLELIHNLSEKTNGNGRIIHEASTNGVVFNPGNINETPQWASTIWEVYRWTGDREFLEKYFPSVEKGLTWLLEENDSDGNLLADGYGMMEIHGLESEMIDVAAYSYKAFADAAQIAEILGKKALSESYQQTADALAEKINAEFWVPEFGSYADFIGTADEAIHLIDGAIIRADTLNKPWAVEELKATKSKLSTLPKDQKQGFVLYHNWVVNTPMEVGVADPEKAQIALKTGRKYTNPFGVFVTGIDRDESAELEEGSFTGSKVFSYTGAVMTLPTGVSAIGENNYGNPDQALDYLKRMTRSFGFALPGSIYEVSPDYGMFTQAWNLYSYAIPIVTQFFGIKPYAGNKVIHIRPQMPSDWEEAKIERVKVGENEITVTYEKKGKNLIIEVNQSQKKWGLSIEIPESYEQVKVLGKEVSSDTQNGYRRILMTGEKVRVEAF